jgi:hypothetical protein
MWKPADPAEKHRIFRMLSSILLPFVKRAAYDSSALFRIRGGCPGSSQVQI